MYISVGIPAGSVGVEVGGELGPWKGRLDRVYPSQLLTLTFRVGIVLNISTRFAERILCRVGMGIWWVMISVLVRMYHILHIAERASSRSIVFRRVIVVCVCIGVICVGFVGIFCW